MPSKGDVLGFSVTTSSTKIFIWIYKWFSSSLHIHLLMWTIGYLRLHFSLIFRMCNNHTKKIFIYPPPPPPPRTYNLYQRIRNFTSSVKRWSSITFNPIQSSWNGRIRPCNGGVREIFVISWETSWRAPKRLQSTPIYSIKLFPIVFELWENVNLSIRLLNKHKMRLTNLANAPENF